MRDIIKKIKCCIVASVMLAVGITMSTATAFASPTQSYTYHSGYAEKQPIASKACYTAKKLINGCDLNTTAFQLPEDLFVKNNMIFLLDSGNNRIVVMDSAYRMVRELKDFTYQNEPMDFTGAKGLFVTDDGLLWIADTQNKRVICADQNAKVRQVLTQPKNDVLPDGFEFIPTAVALDKNGFIYCLSDGSYYGALIFDKDGRFSGFFGANKVRARVSDVIDKIMNLIFGSEAKQEHSEQRLPYQFTDIILDKDNFIYTLTSMTNSQGINFGQIRKLSPGGDNILYYQDGMNAQSSDNFNFGDTSYITDDMGKKLIQNFTGISVSEQELIFAVDSTYGKVFVYDGNCVPLTIFGGGIGAGNQLGTFVMPQSIVLNGTDVLVLDNQTNSITVFEQTDYGKMLFEAVRLANIAEYDKAAPLWKQLLAQDKNCQFAYQGLAKAEMLNKNYHQSLEYAKLGLDQETYAQTYKEVRAEAIQKHFVWMFPLTLVLLGAVVVFMIYTTKRKMVIIKNEKFRTMCTMLYHPFDSAQKIKLKNVGSIWLSVFILAAYYLLEVNWKLNAGFMYNIPDPYSFNAFYILLGTVGVILLWTVVCWGISVLFEGKASMKQLFVVTCYSLLPMLLFDTFSFFASFVILPEEAAIMTVLDVVSKLAVVVLLLIGVMTVEDFNFSKTVGTLLLSLFSLFLATFVIFMVLILFQNFVSFIGTIFYEVSYR